VSGIWPIGVQKNEFNGEVKYKDQVIIRYEINKAIPSGKYEGDRYTLNSWVNLPESFDDRSTFIKIRNAVESRTTIASDYINYDENLMIGGNVILNVTHTKKGKPKIEGYSPLMDGMPKIEALLPRDKPEWVQRQCDKAVSKPGESAPQATQAPQDDLPF